MERSSKRGKIPQKDWPTIIARHEAGETLASIARTYDCSSPAISYIVSRSRARSAAAAAAADPARTPQGEIVLADARPDRAAEPHAEPASGPERQGESATATGSVEQLPPQRPAQRGEPRPLDGAATPGEVVRGNGTSARIAPTGRQDNAAAGFSAGPPPGNAAASSQPNGDARRRLHLTHPQSNAPAYPQNPQTVAGSPPLRGPATARQGYDPAGRPAYPVNRNGAGAGGRAEPPRSKEGGAIDRALRERVDGDIAAFLVAFDDALAEDTLESRAALREATDRLLRAGARTRIELERLEARVPLPPHDTIDRAAVWRQR